MGWASEAQIAGDAMDYLGDVGDTISDRGSSTSYEIVEVVKPDVGFPHMLIREADSNAVLLVEWDQIKHFTSEDTDGLDAADWARIRHVLNSD